MHTVTFATWNGKHGNDSAMSATITVPYAAAEALLKAAGLPHWPLDEGVAAHTDDTVQALRNADLTSIPENLRHAAGDALAAILALAEHGLAHLCWSES
jgi:hypothetical protein